MENCTEMMRTFFQMMAATLVKDGNGVVLGFNMIDSSVNTCECEPVIDCENNHIDTKSIVTQGFGRDICEKNAILFVNCQGIDR